MDSEQSGSQGALQQVWALSIVVKVIRRAFAMPEDTYRECALKIDIFKQVKRGIVLHTVWLHALHCVCFSEVYKKKKTLARKRTKPCGFNIIAYEVCWVISNTPVYLVI